MNLTNIILNVDSYKTTMPWQYPAGTEYVHFYISSRGGPWPATLVVGLQAYLIEYLSKPITQEDIDEAEQIITDHGEPFYRAGWEYILKRHNGYLPLRVSSVPEGTIVPHNNVLLTVVNTDPLCYWLPTHVEPSLLRAIWYPTTVATGSLESKKIISHYLELSGDPDLIDFKLHDFGARGVSSFESAGLGGMAHLVNFKGSDTYTAELFARKYYGADKASFSIPASEHSTITSWGKEGEREAFLNMINQFKKPGAIIACVSDSYNIYNACRIWGSLKQEIIDAQITLVVRPDSGNPVEVVVKCLEILDEEFGSVTNEKGYKVLNNVRVIQGDGITQDTIDRILFRVTEAGYSADNVAFGQGGALLQGVDRDKMKFAMKCSAIRINGVWRDVFKDPITDPGKTSLKGQVQLFTDGTNFVTAVDRPVGFGEALEVVFEDGRIRQYHFFEEIRARAKRWIPVR